MRLYAIIPLLSSLRVFCLPGFMIGCCSLCSMRVRLCTRVWGDPQLLLVIHLRIQTSDAWKRAFSR